MATAPQGCNPTLSITADSPSDPTASPVYTQYFASRGVTENTNNPGNTYTNFEPPVSTMLTATHSCTAARQCADYTANQNDYAYYSFDLHYLINKQVYQCAAYFRETTDISYFDQQNAEVGVVYGYSLQKYYYPPK